MTPAQQATYLVLDTETTGIEAPEHKAVEVAAVLVKNGQITAAFTTYLNPGRDIPPAASGVHGLTLEDVQDAPTLEETLPWLNGLASKADALVAHNAPFDRSMLPGLVSRPWIDTLRLSRKLQPAIESHANQSLRYAMGLRCPEADGMPAHRALSDAYVTARVLVKLLELAAAESGFPVNPEGIEAEILKPLILAKCSFGKHKGAPWAEVPKDYLQWLVRQQDVDMDVLFTAKHYLGVS